MGAWGFKLYDNDTACDWAADCVEADDIAFVENTLDLVLETGNEYLESDLAEAGLAAASTVASLNGKPAEPDSYSAEIEAWAAAHKASNPALVSKALAVVARVAQEPSELLELWQESDELGQWQAAQAVLKTRLTHA